MYTIDKEISRCLNKKGLVISFCTKWEEQRIIQKREFLTSSELTTMESITYKKHLLQNILYTLSS